MHGGAAPGDCPAAVWLLDLVGLLGERTLLECIAQGNRLQGRPANVLINRCLTSLLRMALSEPVTPGGIFKGKPHKCANKVLNVFVSF